MSYNAEISRTHPTAFLFLVDQSGSMSDAMESGRTKAEFVSDVLNRTLTTLIGRCTKSEGLRDYFHIGVVGYSSTGVFNALGGTLAAQTLNPVSLIEASPLRVEQRKKKIDDGAGGIVTEAVSFPVWFEPRASGGTPMCEAITTAAEVLAAWCDQHPESYPPTVLHVTDGESTDGDPEALAGQLRQIGTNDGTVLMFNLHVSTSGNPTVSFPASDAALADQYAKLLYRMSSELPPHLVAFAAENNPGISAEARGFMFNAEAAGIADFFDIGTRAAQLR